MPKGTKYTVNFFFLIKKERNFSITPFFLHMSLCNSEPYVSYVIVNLLSINNLKKDRKDTEKKNIYIPLNIVE